MKTIVCENKMQYGILHWKLKYYFLKFSVKVLKSKTSILKINKESPRMLISLPHQEVSPTGAWSDPSAHGI